MDLAFGRRQLGPAILSDVALFLEKALAETSSGTANYDDEVLAFVTAVRLFAVPQYEGATGTEVASFLQVLANAWPNRSEETWEPLQRALESVALTRASRHTLLRSGTRRSPG